MRPLNATMLYTALILGMKPRSNQLRRLRAYFADLQRVREEDIPYVTRFTTSADRTLDLPKVSEFQGLLLLQYAEDVNGTVEVTAYWKSHDAAKSNARSFEKKLNAGTPGFMGYLKQLKVDEEPWWRRIPLGRWLLYGSSLFGAFAVLQTHFAKLLEGPDIAIELPGSRSLNGLAGEETNFDFSITNRSREVHATATLLMPQLTTLQGISVPQSFELNNKPAPISPSDKLTVPVSMGPLPPGSYTAVINGKVKAGYLRASWPLSVTKEIFIWRRETDARFTSIVPEQEGRALLKGEVLVGAAAPKGLHCQITILKHPEISVPLIDFPGAVSDKPLETTRVLAVSFKTTRAIDSLSRIPFEIILDSSASTAGWLIVQADSAVECERNEDLKQ